MAAIFMTAIHQLKKERNEIAAFVNKKINKQTFPINYEDKLRKAVLHGLFYI